MSTKAEIAQAGETEAQEPTIEDLRVCAEIRHESRNRQKLSTIDQLRRIRAEHHAAAVGDTIIDVQTANAILLVHDAANETTRAKFAALPIKRMAAIAWKFIK